MSNRPHSESGSSSSSAAPQPKPKSIRWWLSRLTVVGMVLGTGVVLIVMLGIAQRIGWLESSGNPESQAAGQAGGAIYTCPMHPQIRQPAPGRCPICGMALVPATAAGADQDEMAVTIPSAQRRLANIQTEEVTIQPVSTTIRTIGAIQIDESRQATIASYIDGRVERLFADYTGVQVEKGDHLAVVYSPQLFSAQVEYAEARRTLNSMSGAALAAVREAQSKLVLNSRQRLVELGMTPEQLTELETSSEAKSRLTIYAPMGGTVIEKMTEEGKYLSAGEPIYRIANLSTVWLMLELYPEDASRIHFGQVVKAELTSLPGETLTGRVAFIDPTVDKANRTVGVRAELNNEDGRLRPGDYAQATIEIPIGRQGEVYDADLAGKWISPMHPQIIRNEPGNCPICGMKLVPTSRYGYADKPVPQPASVVIPRSALLMAGKHSVVYVETKPGRFELRNITLGPVLADKAIVHAGVKPGEMVATSGNFLIDSQMQLAGKPSLIDPTRYVVPPEGEHRNTPLQFDSIAIKTVEGTPGEQLEQLYQAYFEIQQALATDKLPSEPAVAQLVSLTDALRAENTLPAEFQPPLAKIKQNAEHLHHLSLEQARQKFKPISHEIVSLATRLRGAGDRQPFHQFFCPMVKQGEGDWLQAETLLSNPYYGSEMLRCGELVRTIPAATSVADQPTTEAPNERDNAAPASGGTP